MTSKKVPASKSQAKPKINFEQSFGAMSEEAEARADQRFAEGRAARAASLVQQRPSAFAQASLDDRADGKLPPLSREVPAFNSGNFVVGHVYRVPVGLIDPNSWGARVYYKAVDVDRISSSFDRSSDQKQKVAANGFVKPNGRVELIDGGTRLRSATSSGLPFLDVKIEAAPTSIREQFKRSKELNDERSEHTALDLAVQYARLLQEGVYGSQEELAADHQLTKSQVSMYLRIAQIPDRLRRLMVEHEQTSAFTIAYEISGIFSGDACQADREACERVAEDIIREVQAKSMGKQQVITLVGSKLAARRTRARPALARLRFNGSEATLKTFESRGQLDFTIKGLAPADLDTLRRAIEQLCSQSGTTT